MSDELESWYRVLLAAYPRKYRADRGAEIISTLLDGARAGQRRPNVREAAALVSGGLRARIDAIVPTPPTGSGSGRDLARSGLHLAVLLLLACATARELTAGLRLQPDAPHAMPGWLDWLPMGVALATVAAFTAAVAGAMRLVPALAATALTLDIAVGTYRTFLVDRYLAGKGVPATPLSQHVAWLGSHAWLYLTAAVTATVVGYLGRPARHWPAGAVLALIVVVWTADAWVPAGVPDLLLVMSQLAIVVAGLGLALIDARAAVALAGLAVALGLESAWRMAFYGLDTPPALPAVCAVAVVSVALANRVTRRQARL